MQLSIIIVNYNVRFFLEQCLYSVGRATVGLDAEVIIVDNHSPDDSMKYLAPRFPDYRFICNEENMGFAKANNLALPYCKGEYVLFLNPDTLIPEDCLHKCLLYLQANSQAGALGVRMLDGRGRFLPESKRAFPSPAASLFKLTGLAALFPRSGFFNQYALGNLDEHQTNTVQVLAGAFMLVNTNLLRQLRGFDENYFLYGEDIDLSYRIQKAGYKNIYFAETAIIHFKGESSRSNSLGRVGFFYKAMLVFVEKNYQTGSAKLFSYFIRFAIACRAMISVLNRMLKPFLLPIIDGGLVWLSIQLVRVIWINGIRNGKDFGVSFIPYAIPLFALLFVMAAAFTGLYDRLYKTSRAVLSLAFGMVSVLAIYSLLPEGLRFSRGVVLWGGILGSLSVLLFRQLLFFKGNTFFGQETATSGQTVIVGTESDYSEASGLLESALLEEQLLGRVTPDSNNSNALGRLNDLATVKKQMRISEVIFCVGVIPFSEIIAQVELLSGSGFRFLFHLKGSSSMVGSNTPRAGGKLVTPFISYRISDPYQYRMKRMIDLLFSFLFILTAPIHLIINKKGLGLLHNVFFVFKGKQTWVGYASASSLLPRIKTGIITHLGRNPFFDKKVLEKADGLYAKEYDWWMDMVLIFQHYQSLGEQVPG